MNGQNFEHLLKCFRESMHSGRNLPPKARGSALRLLVTAIDLSSVEVTGLSEELLRVQLFRPDTKPFVVAGSVDTSSLFAAEISHMTIMSQEEWLDAAGGLWLSGYWEYVESRIMGIAQVLQPDVVANVPAGGKLPAWVLPAPFDVGRPENSHEGIS